MCNFCPGFLILVPYQINCGSFDFSAPNSGAVDLEIGPYSGEFDQSFLKKSNAQGFAREGGGMIAFGIGPDIMLIHQISSKKYNTVEPG